MNNDMQRVARQQRFGSTATVFLNWTPNLSPKGTTAVSEDDLLVFADLAYPTTMANPRYDLVMELHVADVFARRVYRLKGTVTIVESGGALFDEICHAFETGTRVVY